VWQRPTHTPEGFSGWRGLSYGLVPHPGGAAVARTTASPSPHRQRRNSSLWWHAHRHLPSLLLTRLAISQIRSRKGAQIGRNSGRGPPRRPRIYRERRASALATGRTRGGPMGQGRGGGRPRGGLFPVSGRRAAAGDIGRWRASGGGRRRPHGRHAGVGGVRRRLRGRRTAVGERAGLLGRRREQRKEEEARAGIG
jgi:hypothetical protein